MNLTLVQHVPQEGPGAIADWAKSRGHTLSAVHLYEDQSLPEPQRTEGAVVMGGPMNIYQHRDHPWLPREKRWIERLLSDNRPVLGVCLGSQLLADVLGARVFQNAAIEIGWFPVHFDLQAMKHASLPCEAMEATVLHWHGDTFDLPPGAIRLAHSEGCANQAFAHGRRALGLQFHVEAQTDDVKRWLEVEGELPAGRWIQARDQLATAAMQRHADAVRPLLMGWLDALFQP